MRKKNDFERFIELFPEVELPVTISDNSHLVFSKKNKPFHPLIIQEFIEPIEPEVSDNTTEFIPGFRIAGLKDHHAVVYWRADVMKYQYVLVTFNQFGEMLDKRTIAGTFSDGFQLVQSVATISEKKIIYIASGQSAIDEAKYEAASSAVHRMQLNDDGHIEVLDQE